MRTRRSPRNQERLFRALFPRAEAKPAPSLADRYAFEREALRNARPGGPAAALARRNLARLAAQIQTQDGREPHAHVYGDASEARLTGTPSRKCIVPGCRVVSLDLDEET